MTVASPSLSLIWLNWSAWGIADCVGVVTGVVTMGSGRGGRSVVVSGLRGGIPTNEKVGGGGRSVGNTEELVVEVVVGMLCGGGKMGVVLTTGCDVEVVPPSPA